MRIEVYLARPVRSQPRLSKQNLLVLFLYLPCVNSPVGFWEISSEIHN